MCPLRTEFSREFVVFKKRINDERLRRISAATKKNKKKKTSECKLILGFRKTKN